MPSRGTTSRIYLAELSKAVLQTQRPHVCILSHVENYPWRSWSRIKHPFLAVLWSLTCRKVDMPGDRTSVDHYRNHKGHHCEWWSPNGKPGVWQRERRSPELPGILHSPWTRLPDNSSSILLFIPPQNLCLPFRLATCDIAWKLGGQDGSVKQQKATCGLNNPLRVSCIHIYLPLPSPHLISLVIIYISVV